MVSARVCLQQGFKKYYSKIRSYPPNSELHVCTVLENINKLFFYIKNEKKIKSGNIQQVSFRFNP